jgi:uncharacterized membrane protein YkvA (DUF1232 family)
MGNQNQNQNNNSNQDLNGNNNSENNNENHDAPPSNADNNNENQNVIHEASENNNLNSINPPPPGDNNENQNKINEETNNGEGNTINENPENNSAPPTNENNSDCPVPADLNTYQKHFSFNGLMSKIKETAKKAGLKAIYMALLLYYALESPTCSTMDKAIIYGALGYFISPIDIVPDILPLIGLSDDIAVLAWAYSRIKHNVSDMTREKAKTKLKIWFGEFDEKEIDDL